MKSSRRPGNETVELPGNLSLRLVAFSDYRSQDIEVLLSELSKVQPPPDLILYAGDDVGRFRPSRRKNYFAAIARFARYGLCAIAGNDDLPSARELIGGKRVFNVHDRPVNIGGYTVIGVEGAPRREGIGIGYLLRTEQEILRHLKRQKCSAGSNRVFVLSHAPPEGILDQAVRFSLNGRPRSIGSKALRNFIRGHNDVALVICGHVHRCGGAHEVRYGTTVINAANHDDENSVARLAVIDLYPSKPPGIRWRLIRPVSMVPGIGPVSAERLLEFGIRTVEELAASALDEIRGAFPTGHSPALLWCRARAIVQNAPIALRTPQFSKGPEIYLDIETDLAGSYIWLIGLCVGRGGKYESFFAKSPVQEKLILSKFIACLKRYPNANIFTCSGCRFEERMIPKRLAATRAAHRHLREDDRYTSGHMP